MMTKLYDKLLSVYSEDNGSSGVEYAVLVATIAVAVAAGAALVAPLIGPAFDKIVAAMGG